MLLDTLIIFDYSGTLSLEAPLFAAPDSLMRELAASGLADFGIDSPHIFWDKLVNPTWTEGSTTAAGYKKVLHDSIIASLHPDLSIQRRVRLVDAVAAFADRYFSRSRIDPGWAPILKRINRHPSVKVVIATDHYAEATGYILNFLGEWQIEASAAGDAVRHTRASSFIVANSADIGVHKADLRFWEILKTGLRTDAVRSILLIDDFGCNEQSQDVYSEKHKVETRIKQTITTLESVFSASVQVVPVMIGADLHERDRRWENAVLEASVTIDRHLAAGKIHRLAEK